MTPATDLMSIEQFRARYAGIKPYFEYWHGEAFQKSMPTWLHSLVQGLIRDLLKEAGYKAGAEIELRIDADWQPVPDVIAASEIEQPYPSKPVDVVVEILSPNDQMNRVLEKCGEYSRTGLSRIFVIDPEHRGAYVWQAEADHLASVLFLSLPNGSTIDLADLWTRLDRELEA